MIERNGMMVLLLCGHLPHITCEKRKQYASANRMGTACVNEKWLETVLARKNKIYIRIAVRKQIVCGFAIVWSMRQIKNIRNLYLCPYTHSYCVEFHMFLCLVVWASICSCRNDALLLLLRLNAFTWFRFG